MDILDAENEDPFTLESLESLVHSHAQKGLDFILARVTTVDPDDEQRFYYSYYAAHHINKVLFRTQPEEGLLHRMRAKNPLNNMTIVGDVHYYVVSCAYAQERIRDLSKMQKPKSPLAKLGSILSKAVFSPTERKSPVLASQSNNSQIVGNSGSLIASGSNTASATVASPGHVRNHFRSKSGGTPVASEAPFQRFVNQVSGTSGKKKSLVLIARPEAYEEGPLPLSGTNVSYGATMASASLASSTTTAGPRNLGGPTGSGVNPAINHVRTSTLTRQDSRRNSYDDAYKDPMPVNAAAGSSAGGNANSGPSTVPLATQAELDLQRHRKVRSFAYSNDHTASMTITDWLRVQSINKSKSSQSSPVHASPSVHEHQRNGGVSSAADPEPLPEFIYEATYYASDDDFLMKASVRAYFKENALESADAVLFTITTSSEPSNRPSDQHPALMNFLYSVSENESDSQAYNRINTAHLLKWMVGVYALLAFVIIKFFVPTEFIFVVSFVLVFLFCIILIILI
ncbi:hypothetical protein BC831DRAFT_472345 [Entophlyctis helioformis]|nr:hypothetical protein BC831DRAFT_472345 [Entophlyctis helioformis]